MQTAFRPHGSEAATPVSLLLQEGRAEGLLVLVEGGPAPS